MKKIKLEQSSVIGQIYLTPIIKYTHDRILNGSKELIFGWFNFQIIFSW